MQGNEKVIEHLNKILSNELRAINQYFLHSRMLSDWGLDKFAQYEYGESMDEMKHADVLIQRILFLEGLPNMTYLGNVYIADEPIEILHNDLKLENEAIPDLRKAILACEDVNDFVSRDLLQKILESEEEHVDHLETQLDLLDKVGNENFLQTLITAD
jgi:bacterioferritin